MENFIFCAVILGIGIYVGTKLERQDEISLKESENIRFKGAGLVRGAIIN